YGTLNTRVVYTITKFFSKARPKPLSNSIPVMTEPSDNYSDSLREDDTHNTEKALPPVAKPLKSLTSRWPHPIFDTMRWSWTILLTFTTQRLALRQQLNLENSLTAKHDANEAWLGLGSSLLAVLKLRQLGVGKDALNSIFLPLLYLAGIASLHSIGSNMFGLEFKAVNNSFSFTSQGLPDFTATDRNALGGSGALLTMLSLDDLDFPGLAPRGIGVTYDLPNLNETFPPTIQHVDVAATYFNVTCGSLSGSVQNMNESGTAYSFEPGLGLDNIVLSGSDAFPNTLSQHSVAIRPAPWGYYFTDPSDVLASWPSSILIFTTVSVVDSFNTTIQPVPVSPPMTYIPQNQTVYSSTSQITALACNLTVDTLFNISIDTSSFFLKRHSIKHITKQANKTSAKLNAFPTTLRTTPVDVFNSPEDALIALWSQLPIASVSPLSEQVTSLCTQNNSLEICGTLYESEQFVMESLNIFPDLLLPSTSNNVESIDLAELENLLSRMTAIEIWAEGQGNDLKFANQITTSEGVTTNKTVITHNNERVYNDFFLSFGFDRTKLFTVIGIVVTLLLLAAPSILDNNDLKIDSIGILQMIWLAHIHADRHALITKLENPSTDDLRKEGLKIKQNFYVDFRSEHLPS
ncbi:hypothetical protein EV360DRAFT_75776, partial [Lentinula raphanica]